MPYRLGVLESYSDGARLVVSTATSEARSLEHARVGTEHLLLGLLTDGTGPCAELLRRAGATLPAARHMVVEVVGTTDSMGGSELPFTARAQRALERAARFSRQGRAHEVGTEHVLLGVLDVEGLACQVLRRLDVDMAYLQGALTARAEEPIPDQTEPARPAVMTARVCCPSCQVALDDNTVAEHVVHPRQEGHSAKPVALIYCTSCGTALGAARP